MQEQPIAPLFYRSRDLPKLTGLSKSEIYRRIKEGEFPAPIRLGTQLSGWVPQDILAWRDRIISQSQAV
jgi:prophage regulatory protein